MADAQLVSKINDLRTRIESLEQQKNQLVGQRTALQERLKTEFGVKNMTEANAKLAELNKQIETESVQVQDLIASIEEKVSNVENELR